MPTTPCLGTAGIRGATWLSAMSWARTWNPAQVQENLMRVHRETTSGKKAEGCVSMADGADLDKQVKFSGDSVGFSST